MPSRASKRLKTNDSVAVLAALTALDNQDSDDDMDGATLTMDDETLGLISAGEDEDEDEEEEEEDEDEDEDEDESGDQSGEEERVDEEQENEEDEQDEENDAEESNVVVPSKRKTPGTHDSLVKLVFLKHYSQSQSSKNHLHSRNIHSYSNAQKEIFTWHACC
jgi:hypothetical protein